MTRFPMDANTVADATEYLTNRAIQLLADGVVLQSFATLGDPQNPWGVQAILTWRDKTYQSIYVLADHRSRGLLTQYANQKSTLPFLTTPGCGLEEFFKTKGFVYQLLGQFTTLPEYRAIEEHYGYRRAKRSRVPLMNHIDEGLAILSWIGASENTKLAYCLHPLFQEDGDLVASFARLSDISSNIEAVVLTMEYRNIANAYLSTRDIHFISEINLGPLEPVRQMLIADKVQNYKDFLRHHLGTHPRSDALDAYFKNWLARLDIPIQTFFQWSHQLDVARMVQSPTSS